MLANQLEDPEQGGGFDYAAQGQPAASPYPYGIPPNGGNQAGYMDISYWNSRGVPTEQMFDVSTGQLKPGWTRTARGYEQQAAPAVAPGPTGPGPTGGGDSYLGGDTTYYGPRGGGGGGMGGGSGQFDYGRPEGNRFSPYQSMAPFASQGGRFNYAAFTPTNREQLYDENVNPGFQRSQDRLRKMIEAGAAYRGVLRSGNTFNDLGSVLGNNEEQQFKSFDDRRFRDWGGNRENAADAWSRNLGAEQWGYGQQATENERSNNYRFNTEKANFDDLLSRWGQLVQSTTALARPS